MLIWSMPAPPKGRHIWKAVIYNYTGLAIGICGKINVQSVWGVCAAGTLHVWLQFKPLICRLRHVRWACVISCPLQLLSYPLWALILGNIFYDFLGLCCPGRGAEYIYKLWLRSSNGICLYYIHASCVWSRVKCVHTVLNYTSGNCTTAGAL